MYLAFKRVFFAFQNKVYKSTNLARWWEVMRWGVFHRQAEHIEPVKWGLHPAARVHCSASIPTPSIAVDVCNIVNDFLFKV